MYIWPFYTDGDCLEFDDLFMSDALNSGNERTYSLFPVVTLNSELLEESSTSGVNWNVNIN